MTIRDKIIELFGPGYAVGFEDGGWPVYAPRVGHWHSAEIFVTSEGRYYLGRCCLPIHTFEQFSAVYRVFAGIEDPRVVGLETELQELSNTDALTQQLVNDQAVRIAELESDLAEAVEACTIECPCCGGDAASWVVSDGDALECGCDGQISCCSETYPYAQADECACGGDGYTQHTEPGVARTKRRGGGE